MLFHDRARDHHAGGLDVFEAIPDREAVPVMPDLSAVLLESDERHLRLSCKDALHPIEPAGANLEIVIHDDQVSPLRLLREVVHRRHESGILAVEKDASVQVLLKLLPEEIARPVRTGIVEDEQFIFPGLRELPDRGDASPGQLDVLMDDHEN